MSSGDNDWVAIAGELRALAGLQVHPDQFVFHLDLYIRFSFEFYARFSSAQAMDQGIAAAASLFAMCDYVHFSHIPERYSSDPFFPEVQLFRDRHPLWPSCSDRYRATMYFCRLFPMYRAWKVKEYTREYERKQQQARIKLQDRRVFVELMSHEGILEPLDKALEAAMLRVTAVAAFEDGMVGEYRRRLLSVCPDDGRYYWEHILEEKGGADHDPSSGRRALPSGDLPGEA